MARDQFRDGAGILATYAFEINHFTEKPSKQTLNLTRTALTTGVGYVRQVGTPSPQEQTWSGDILTQAQLNAMQSYYNACAGIGTPPRTVFLQDFTGVEHEVMITEFDPMRVWTARNPRDPVNAPFHYWTYDLVFEVIS